MSPTRDDTTEDDQSVCSDVNGNGNNSLVLAKIDTNNAPARSDYVPPTKEYGEQWRWDSVDLDYTRVDENGVKHYYTEYQKRDRVTSPTKTDSPDKPSPTTAIVRGVKRTGTGESNGSFPKSRLPVELPPWATPLDERFQVVSKPKRFFSVGRIFKTIWFEPGWRDPSKQDPPGRLPTTPDWQNSIQGYFREKPIAKYRWFVVVRRRLHHSICFSIGTYGGKSSTNPNKAARGRDMDYVVLHKSSVEPARPFPEEKITREPVAVIIEDEEQYISPIARLDCGRLYTVEDHLKVMKVGRVHPTSLETLERYYKDSVA
ncbi:hypothetical protein QBC38DRAFT_374827 [Podospora fimiseda]|uniref:DUF6590 domain-containing protein n=1 Tax=Podospora fimiseda TaxID=252190 RepID=A0AAN6YR35_9PEZI|nr:hypothetical protein QBC38DRAFT_374827 [Podospora fimiseda]